MNMDLPCQINTMMDMRHMRQTFVTAISIFRKQKSLCGRSAITEILKNLLKCKHVNVVAYSYSDINEVPPLHYHLSDATGRTVEVTFVEGRIVVIDNPIGVHNNPDLNWHYENLKHYMHAYKIDNTFSKQFNLGNMNGTFGLPGGYTSGERFVRAAYLVHHLLPNSDDRPILDAFRNF